MAIVMVLICVGAWAADPDKIIYEENWKGDAYIVMGYDGIAEGELVIPAEYNGLPVTYIMSLAFVDHKLTSLIIPEGVEGISEHAFRNNQLTHIIIPDSVTFIGNNAFILNNISAVSLPQNIEYTQGGWDQSFDVNVAITHR